MFAPIVLTYQTLTTGANGEYLIFDSIDTIDTDRPTVSNVNTAGMGRFATNATTNANVAKQLNGTFGRIPHIVISYTTRFIGITALSGRK
jgi:hypothetical protein